MNYCHGSKQKELKEQEIRTLFITPALQQKGWAVSVNMREEYYFTDGRVLVVGNQHSVAEGKKPIIYYIIKISPSLLLKPKTINTLLEVASNKLWIMPKFLI